MQVGDVPASSQAPFQPRKPSDEAVRVTSAKAGRSSASQEGGQLIGPPVTVPLTVLSSSTLTLRFIGLNVPTTPRSAESTTIVHSAMPGHSGTLQPTKVDPGTSFGVSVTVVPE